MDRLPEQAADLVQRRVAVIAVSGGCAPALAAKAATTTIPIVFTVGDDPVRLGLIASFARPDGNVTGVNFWVTELAAKRLELLRELVPAVARIAVLVNPAEPTNTELTLKDIESAARGMGLQIKPFAASSGDEINAAFGSFVRERPDAVLVGADAFFTARRTQLALLAGPSPAASCVSNSPIRRGRWTDQLRNEFGRCLSSGWRLHRPHPRRCQACRPAVVRASNFELVINAETARLLDLKVPPSVLARADEVIE